MKILIKYLKGDFKEARFEGAPYDLISLLVGPTRGGPMANRKCEWLQNIPNPLISSRVRIFYFA